MEELKAKGTVLYEGGLKKGQELVTEVGIQVAEKFAGFGRLLGEGYRGWGQ